MITGFPFHPRHGKNAPPPVVLRLPANEARSMTESVPYYPDVSQIADAYDGFVLDIWGVIHDGVTLYPGVVETLGELERAGKRVVMLTNAPRRAWAVVDQMIAMGMPERFCGAIMSSGEATWLGMGDAIHTAGRRCLHIGPDRDLSLIEGLDVELVHDADAADLVLNTGPWRDEEQVADYEDVLRAACARKLHMICANPDLEVIRGGTRIICAGALAQRYETLGGPVTYFGKPHPEIYERCFELLGIGDRERILAIGDSLRTDIAGAAAAGIASALVLGGLHGDEIGWAPDGAPDPAGLARLMESALHAPDMVLPDFIWNHEPKGAAC